MKTQTPLFLLLLLAATATVCFSAVSDDIAKICSITTYKDLCISTTQPLAPTNGTVIDHNLVLQLEMSVLRSRIEDIVEKVDVLIAKPPTLPPVAEDPNAQPRYISALSVCREQMNDTAIVALNTAYDDVKAGNSYMFTQHLTGVTAAATDCEESFDGVPTTFWPASEVQDINHITDNCLAILQDVSPEYHKLPAGGRKRL